MALHGSVLVPGNAWTHLLSQCGGCSWHLEIETRDSARTSQNAQHSSPNRELSSCKHNATRRRLGKLLQSTPMSFCDSVLSRFLTRSHRVLNICSLVPLSLFFLATVSCPFANYLGQMPLSWREEVRDNVH